MGQITTTRNLVAIKEVRHAGQKEIIHCGLVTPHGDKNIGKYCFR